MNLHETKTMSAPRIHHHHYDDMLPRIDVERIQEEQRQLKKNSQDYKTTAIPKKVIEYNYQMAMQRMIRKNPKKEHPTRRDYIQKKIQHNISYFNNPEGDGKKFETLLVGASSVDDLLNTGSRISGGNSFMENSVTKTLNLNNQRIQAGSIVSKRLSKAVNNELQTGQNTSMDTLANEPVNMTPNTMDISQQTHGAAPQKKNVISVRNNPEPYNDMGHVTKQNKHAFHNKSTKDEVSSPSIQHQSRDFSLDN